MQGIVGGDEFGFCAQTGSGDRVFTGTRSQVVDRGSNRCVHIDQVLRGFIFRPVRGCQSVHGRGALGVVVRGEDVRNGQRGVSLGGLDSEQNFGVTDVVAGFFDFRCSGHGSIGCGTRQAGNRGIDIGLEFQQNRIVAQLGWGAKNRRAQALGVTLRQVRLGVTHTRDSRRNHRTHHVTGGKNRAVIGGQPGHAGQCQIGRVGGVIAELEVVAVAEVKAGDAFARYRCGHRFLGVGQVVQRKQHGLGGGQLVFHQAVGGELAVLVDVQLFAVDVAGLLQGRVHRVLTHIHMGLPGVGRAGLVGVFGLHVVHRGQVAVTTGVVHGKGSALVVSGRVGAVELVTDNRRISGEVQAQRHRRGLFGFARCLLRNGQDHAVVDVGATGRVNRRCHQTLACGVHHVVLFIQQKRAVTGVGFLQAVGRAHGEKTVAGDRQIQRVGRERNIALAEFLAHLLQRNALTDRRRCFLQRRGRKNVAEVGARALEAGGTHVGNIVGRHAQHGGGGIQPGQRGIKRHGSGLLMVRDGV